MTSIAAKTPDALALAKLRPPPWSQRRWRFVANGGPMIVHVLKRKGRPVLTRVPSHRLIPLDRTRYPGPWLRAIRATTTNNLGQVRR